MPLTVLSDDQVRDVLENLTRDELDGFTGALASALHEFSTNVQADEDGVFQQPHRITTQHPETRATTLYMPSCGPEGMGCKVVSLTTSAVTQDPNVQPISPTGVVNLFSPDGKLIGVVNASTLTAFRTALGSVCLLSRRSHVKTITVFGTGMQAYWHIRLALMLRGSSIKHIYIINHRFSDSAAHILRKFTIIPAEVKRREGWDQAKFAILTPSFHEFDRLQKDHLRASDVIYCCTPSRKELFDASILTNHEGRKKGRLIVAVGSFTPEMREIPEGLLLQAVKHHDKGHRHFHKHADEGGVIVVDTLEGVLKEAGEIIDAKIPANQLVELGELVMLHRLALEESESESLAESESSLPLTEGTAMSSVYSKDSGSPRSTSPTGSHGSGHKSHHFHLPLPFRRGSHTSDHSNDQKQQQENRLCHWLRDGTVIYKSVGLGLMDLVVGNHLVKVATEKKMGTTIDSF